MLTCKRCGKCCESSSPTLHVSDLTLVTSKYIDWTNLYTLRKGEYVWDNINRKPIQAPTEMIKIREGENGGCVCYDPAKRACTIYSHRPAECVALFCEDTSRFFEVYDTPRLTRNDIIRDPSLLRLVEEQELKCPYGNLVEWISRIKSEGERAVNRIIQLLRFDYDMRRLVNERLGVPPSHMDLLFGRPMMETIGAFGLKVVKEPDGSFLLTTKQKIGAT